MESRGTLFREIHKNTWLKRVTADNRKIPVGIKVCLLFFGFQLIQLHILYVIIMKLESFFNAISNVST